MKSYLIYTNTMIYLGIATICIDHEINPNSFEFWLVLFGLVVLTLMNGLCYPREEQKTKPLILQQCPKCNHQQLSIKPVDFCSNCGEPLPKQSAATNNETNNKSNTNNDSNEKDDLNK